MARQTPGWPRQGAPGASGAARYFQEERPGHCLTPSPPFPWGLELAASKACSEVGLPRRVSIQEECLEAHLDIAEAAEHEADVDARTRLVFLARVAKLLGGCIVVD